VVYDEWGQLGANLALSESPYQGLSDSPLVLGLKAREERLKAILDKVQAAILVAEPFCASALEEAWFRSTLKIPILVLESDSLGNLDATSLSRLENFANVAFSGRGRGGGGRQA